MAWRPIARTPVQYEKADGNPANGYYLKFYLAATTTPQAMATDTTGSVTLAKCKLNESGYPLSNPNDEASIFIPHVNTAFSAFRYVIYASAADADANNFSSSVVNISSVYQLDDIDSYLSQTIKTIATYSDISAALPDLEIGQQFILLGHTVTGKGGGIFNVVSSSGRTANNGTCVINGAKAAIRQSQGGRGFSIYDFGAMVDGVTSDSTAINNANSSGELITAPAGEILLDQPTYLRQFRGSGRYINQTRFILTGAGQLLPGDAYSTWSGFSVSTSVNNKIMIKNDGHSYFTCTDFRLYKTGGSGQRGVEFDCTNSDIYFNIIDNFSLECDYPVRILGDLGGGAIRAFNSNILGRNVAGNKWFQFQSAITVEMGTGVCDANEFNGYYESGVNIVTIVSGSATPFKQNRIKAVQDAVTRIINSSIAITNQNYWEVLDVGPFTFSGVMPQNQIIVGPVKTKIRATDTYSTGVLTTAVEKVMTFDAETYDTNSEFVIGTGIFTPKETGWYSVSCSAATQAYTWPLNSKFELRLYKNASIYSSDVQYSETSSAATIPFSCRINSDVYMVGGTDTLSVKIIHNRGNNTSLDSAPTLNFINISRLND